MSNSNIIDEINVLKELFGKLIDILTKLNESIEAPKEAVTDVETRLKSLEDKVDKILTLLHEKEVTVASETVPAKEEPIPSPEKPIPEAVGAVTEKPTPSKATEQVVTPEIQPQVRKEPETELKEEVSLPPMSEISVPEEPFSEAVPETKPPAPVDVEAVKNQINQLKENLVELERQISDLEFNYEGGFIEFTEYQSRITDLKSRREKLVKEIRELEQKISG